MALIDTAESLARHLRRAEALGPFNCAHGCLLIIQEHEINPLLYALENQIRAYREGGAAEVVLKAGVATPINPPAPKPPMVVAKPTAVTATMNVQTKASKVAVPAKA